MKENELREKPGVVRNTLRFETKMIGLMSKHTERRLLCIGFCHDDVQRDIEEARHDDKKGRASHKQTLKI